LRLHITLRHALYARIIVRLEPRSTYSVIQQLAVSRGQVFALAGEKHPQDSVAFFTQRKAHCISVTFSGESAARPGITQIAA